MAGENTFKNIRGVAPQIDFAINTAAPAQAAKLFASTEGLATELTSGAFTELHTADPSFGNGADLDLVNAMSAPGTALPGDSGYLSAPFASLASPCDGLLVGTLPGLEVGAGVPIFAAADMMDVALGPFTRLSCSGAAGNWFGLRDTFALPSNYVRGPTPRRAIAYARLAVPDIADLSFFIGGLEGASAVLASGADPTAAGMTGAAAFVKLAADANWNAFVRLPGSGAPTKVDLGAFVVAGTTYIFLLECLLGTGGGSGSVKFSVYNSLGTVVLGSTTIGGFPAPSVSSYLFDVGAFTATAAARSIDVSNAMVVQLDSFDA